MIKNYIVFLIHYHQIDQASLGLSRSYYLLDLDQVLVIREAYVKFGIKMAELFGADSTTAETDMMRIIELETDLANVSIHYKLTGYV